jgi:hypothetical protein
VQDEALAKCVDQNRSQFLGNANRRGWWLVPGDASTACK